MNDKAIELLLEIKGDLGRVEGKLDSRPCLLHQQELRDLNTKIEAVDTKVDGLGKRVDSLDWWSRGRNKLIAAIAVALLGLASAVAGDLLKDYFKPAAVQARESVNPPGTPDKAPNSPFGGLSVPGATTSPDVFVPGLDGQVSGPVPQDGEDR